MLCTTKAHNQWTVFLHTLTLFLSWYIDGNTPLPRAGTWVLPPPTPRPPVQMHSSLWIPPSVTLLPWNSRDCSPPHPAHPPRPSLLSDTSVPLCHTHNHHWEISPIQVGTMSWCVLLPRLSVYSCLILHRPPWVSPRTLGCFLASLSSTGRTSCAMCTCTYTVDRKIFVC